jgi:hypothetical protein
MTLTGQITPFTCPLACLESFAQDLELPYTQDSLLRDHAKMCNVGTKHDDQAASGALNLIQFVDLCQDLGLQPKLFHDLLPEATIPLLLRLTPRETVIFFIVRFDGRDGATHYVRYSHMSAPGVFEVMNPQFSAPLFHPISWEQLVAWETYCVRLTAPEPQPK